jgi:hypothetical protein
MASELPDLPRNMQRLYRHFDRWRGADTGRLPITVRVQNCLFRRAVRSGPRGDRRIQEVVDLHDFLGA